MAPITPKSSLKGSTAVTPLPTGQLTILCIVLLTESICSTMLIPFVGLYVSFMQGWEVEEAGYAAGFLVGLFMLGQVISSKAWGVASERAGRKICIGFGVGGCAIAMFLFGLSTNIYMCALWRFVHGLSAGCSLVAKSMIADVTDRTNQAKGYALVSLTWGVGTLIGPSVGGFFYDPAEKAWLGFLGFSKDGFFARHPAFLPSLLAASYNVVAVCTCVLFLSESNKNAVPLYSILPRFLREPLKPYLRFIQPKLPGCVATTPHDEAATAVTIEAIVPKDQQSSSTEMSSNPHSPQEGKDIEKGMALEEHTAVHVPEETTSAAVNIVVVAAKPPSFGFKQAFQHPVTRYVCIMSMLISGADMIYAEVFPLWTIAPPTNGGLGLSSGSVGILILANSIPAVGSNIVFARVIKCFRDEMTYWRLCQIMYAVTTLLIPVALYFGALAYWYTMAMGMVRKLFESWTFAMIMLVVAQTAPPGKVSVMYGIQQATSCMVRSAVPFIFAPLFAWSIASPRPFPINHFLLYILSAIPLIISVVVSFQLESPESSYHHHDGDDGAEQLVEFPAEEGRRNPSFSVRRSLRTSFVSNPPLSDSDDDHVLFLHNSFATLAHSFATNIVPGILQPTILQGGHSNLEVDALCGSYSGYNNENNSNAEIDSRDASSQQGDNWCSEDDAVDQTNVSRDGRSPLLHECMIEEDSRLASPSEDEFYNT